METGSLPVPSASQILPVVNQLVSDIKQRGGLVIATQVNWLASLTKVVLEI